MPYRLMFEIKRFLNQRHRYDFPSENNGWKKVGKKPVYGDESTGTIFDPYVYLEGDTFIMIASERKSGSLIRVESKDGETWGNRQVVLEGVKDSWEEIVNRGCLIEVNGYWHLWYTGQKDGVSSIGYAKGQSLQSLKRVQQTPVLQTSEIFEGVSAMNPCVIWNDKKHLFQMWYAAGEDYEPDVICYAESKDGMIWIKYSSPVLTKSLNNAWESNKVGGCQVVINEDYTYSMYYIGYQNIDVTRICLATSADGLVWNRTVDNLQLGPSKGSWDSDAVYKPTVVLKADKELLWYNGRSKHKEYIGLAIKNKYYNENFNLVKTD